MENDDRLFYIEEV